MEEKLLAGIGPTGHSGIHIKSELDNPIYAAGNPRTTSNSKPSGWGASPHRYGKEIEEPQMTRIVTDQRKNEAKQSVPICAICGPKQTALREEKALAEFDPIGHSGIHIQSR